MKKSEDVTRLFAMFGEEKTGQYQEIYKADQNREASKRWPIFQSVHFNAEQSPETAAPKPKQAAQPLEKPFIPEAHSDSSLNMTETRLEFGEDEPSLSPMDDSQGGQYMGKTKEEAPSQSPMDSSETSLHSLFKRLESPQEAPVEAPAIEPVIEPEVATGSIRSLFNRLTRS